MTISTPAPAFQFRTTYADGTQMPTGKVMMMGWMNVYRSGVFHRTGKPGAADRHPGDFYPTRELAEKDIELRTHFICTCPVEWEDFEVVTANDLDSKPVPLSVTRKLVKLDHVSGVVAS